MKRRKKDTEAGNKRNKEKKRKEKKKERKKRENGRMMKERTDSLMHAWMDG